MNTSAHRLLLPLALALLALPVGAQTGLLASRPQAGAYEPPGCAETRTVIDAIPYVITSPGSYVLTHSLTLKAADDGQPAIDIQSDLVTLDLGGHSLETAGTAMVAPAIRIGDRRMVRIRDGVLLGWQGAGVEAGAGSLAVTVEDVLVRDCRGGGLLLPGAGSRVQRVDVTNSMQVGIEVGDHARVRSVTLAGNPREAVLLGDAGTLVDANARTSDGVSAVPLVSAGDRCRIERTHVSRPLAGLNHEGIVCGDDGLVLGSQVQLGDTNGYHVGAGSLVADCAVVGTSASNFVAGYVLEDGAGLRRCTSTGVWWSVDALGAASVLDARLESTTVGIGTTGSTAAPVLVAGGRIGSELGVNLERALFSGVVLRTVQVGAVFLVRSLALDLDAQDVAGTGITAVNSDLVRCRAQGNATRGFHVQRSVVRDCEAIGNAGSGFFVEADCLLTGSRAIGNMSGVDLVASGSVVLRNTARANSVSNFSLGTGNDVGPVSTAAAQTSPAGNVE